MMSPDDYSLSIHQLSLQYAGVTVLDDINLSVPKGAVVGLVGRNGAGKSSLLRCMLGLSVPHSGKVNILGSSAKSLSNAVRERLGYVPQQPELVESMNVWQHIEYIGSFYTRWAEQRARELCIKIELPLGLEVKNLSVGDKQKLSIVLALAHDPELVLLDEPVASLDPVMRRNFMRILFNSDEQRTVLLSSHLLGDLERVASHIAFLRDGKLQLFGEWDAISENLRIVTLPHSAANETGIQTQRQEDAQWRAVVDLRTVVNKELVTLAANQPQPSLDDLFVEFNL